MRADLTMTLTFTPAEVLEVLKAKHPEIPNRAAIRVARPARLSEVKSDPTRATVKRGDRDVIAVLGCEVSWSEMDVPFPLTTEGT